MEYIYLNKENEKKAIEQIVKTIKSGGVAIIPTDTIYGLSVDALNENAVKKIYDLKKRDLSKPCNILVSGIEMMREVTKNISTKEEEIIKKYSPRSINNNTRKKRKNTRLSYSK